MGRPRIFSDEELMEVLAKIERNYGFLAISTLQKAHTDEPYTYPSYKMFERRMGGMKTFNTPDFRDRIQPFLDTIDKEKEATPIETSDSGVIL